MTPIMRDYGSLGKFMDLRTLKSWEASANDNGDWINKGVAKVRPQDEDGEDIWWPDTGDVLSVFHARPFSKDEATSPIFTTDERGENWKVYPSARLGKASLPEMLFRDPIDYFQRFACTKPPATGVDGIELYEMHRKVSSIRIPKSALPESYVLHKWTYDYVYEGFSLETGPLENVRRRGCAVVDNRINLN